MICCGFILLVNRLNLEYFISVESSCILDISSWPFLHPLLMWIASFSKHWISLFQVCTMVCTLWVLDGLMSMAVDWNGFMMVNSSGRRLIWSCHTKSMLLLSRKLLVQIWIELLSRLCDCAALHAELKHWHKCDKMWAKKKSIKLNLRLRAYLY